jgi:predicted permease
MTQLLTRAGAFVAVIGLGIFLRWIGLFKKEDFRVLSAIVIKITLPAAIITSFSVNQIRPDMLALSLLGFGGGALYMLLGYVSNLRQDKEQKAFAVLNLPGYNIGAFALPFCQSFLGPVGVVATCLFDTGNAFICLGGSFAIATMIKDGSGFSWKRLVKSLATSVPFVCYMIMVPLNLMHIQLPSIVLELAGIASNANAFMAMLAIGVGFQLTGDKRQLGTIFRVLGIRYAVAAVLALCYYFLLPFPLAIRQALVILCFAPIGTAVPPFTRELGGDVGLSSAINSMAIVCSILFMVTLLGIMQ